MALVELSLFIVFMSYQSAVLCFILSFQLSYHFKGFIHLFFIYHNLLMMNSFYSFSSLIEPYGASPISPPNLFCEETYQNAIFDKL